jgi:8-oxo-dGTP diphosphatase
MCRSDNNVWQMPGGGMEVGETPAAAVVREAYEETGVRCEPIALVGVYDSRLWDTGGSEHIYKFTFLCKPLSRDQWNEAPSHTLETSETGWFAADALPDDLFEGHHQRIHDAFRVWRGDLRAHFDL